MKKILGALVASTALMFVPQPVTAHAAPLCPSSTLLPVSVGVRCASGNTFCQVYVYANTGGVLATQRICVTL
jgi:hypothetical protein